MKTNKAIEAARMAIVLAICLVGASFGVIGCQNTAEGVATDAQKDTAAVGNAADKAADATKTAADAAAKSTEAAGKNAGDALTLTPKVKDALMADSTVGKETANINVNTHDGVVHLEGHVSTNAVKKQASDVATKAVTAAGSKDKVMNQLTVTSH